MEYPELRSQPEEIEGATRRQVGRTNATVGLIRSRPAFNDPQSQPVVPGDDEFLARHDRVVQLRQLGQRAREVAKRAIIETIVWPAADRVEFENARGGRADDDVGAMRRSFIDKSE